LRYHRPIVDAGRPALLSLLLVLTLPSALFAQDPVAVAPSLYKVEIDNAWVRVLRLTVPPHGRTPGHAHPNQVIVSLGDAPPRVRFRPAATEAEGKPVEHAVEDVIIELKQRPPTSTPIALDPVVIDPKYHSVLLENQFVRAIRTVLEPGIKSPLHEHPHYVVVYLTELHTTMKLGDGREVDNPRRKGEIGWRDSMKHETLNIGKETAAEIQVELK
jgi:quercetin dioxygenase-like cupin family protein